MSFLRKQSINRDSRPFFRKSVATLFVLAAFLGGFYLSTTHQHSTPDKKAIHAESKRSLSSEHLCFLCSHGQLGSTETGKPFRLLSTSVFLVLIFSPTLIVRKHPASDCLRGRAPPFLS
ncbi:hypothetical protein EHO61_00055 [Leptospira fluminis]|uniref:Uncharacterized protein n=1 Tax=Leptospira fluminis TaxID=2484979 RepID=A0A4R9GV48_9LEPT|nr:hypothetical protein [Leptospira fluminis]TGK22217.1 hypothetical protein EHO61_00055 [Leptospira fluminis]